MPKAFSVHNRHVKTSCHFGQRLWTSSLQLYRHRMAGCLFCYLFLYFILLIMQQQQHQQNTKNLWCLWFIVLIWIIGWFNSLNTEQVQYMIKTALIGVSIILLVIYRKHVYKILIYIYKHCRRWVEDWRAEKTLSRLKQPEILVGVGWLILIGGVGAYLWTDGFNNYNNDDVPHYSVPTYTPPVVQPQPKPLTPEEVKAKADQEEADRKKAEEDAKAKAAADEQKKWEDNTIYAFQCAQAYLRNAISNGNISIPDPDTAKFPWADYKWVYMGSWVYAIKTYFTAKNDYNANVRYNYVCKVVWPQTDGCVYKEAEEVKCLESGTGWE